MIVEIFCKTNSNNKKMSAEKFDKKGLAQKKLDG